MQINEINATNSINNIFNKDEDEQVKKIGSQGEVAFSNDPGPAYQVEESQAKNGPKVYSIAKDDQGKWEILLDGKPGVKDKANELFLQKAEEALQDLPVGRYLARLNDDGTVDVKAITDEDTSPAADTDALNGDKAQKQLMEKNGETSEDDKKTNEDEGWSWCITELIPDPQDPDNPQKAKRRIVAQGKGRTPGVNQP